MRAEVTRDFLLCFIDCPTYLIIFASLFVAPSVMLDRRKDIVTRVLSGFIL